MRGGPVRGRKKSGSGTSLRPGFAEVRSILAFINFVPLSPGGTCVFMRHTEAYKRRAISDTIKMCISRALF